MTRLIRTPKKSNDSVQDCIVLDGVDDSYQDSIVLENVDESMNHFEI